jgi:hypothetical protein
MTAFGARPTSRQSSGSTDFPVQNELLGRSTSITKIERPRSANQLQRPRGRMCKLRQRGREYGGRPAGSRGIDPSLQPLPRSHQLLGPSYGRAASRPTRPLIQDKPKFLPVRPASDIGIALFGGLFWICTVPKKRPQPGGKLRPSQATMPGRPGTKWMWVSAPPVPINSALAAVPVQNASVPFPHSDIVGPMFRRSIVFWQPSVGRIAVC